MDIKPKNKNPPNDNIIIKDNLQINMHIHINNNTIKPMFFNNLIIFLFGNKVSIHLNLELLK